MRNRTILSFLVAIVLLGSCRQKTITCSVPQLYVYGTGFTTSDFSDTTVIYKYAPNGNFDTVLDSAFQMHTTKTSGDTFNVALMDGQNDFKIKLVSTGKTYSFSGIKLAGNYTQTISTGLSDLKYYMCYNAIVSVNVNGTAVPATPSKMDQGIDQIFFSK